jgi:hypothetical protein
VGVTPEELDRRARFVQAALVATLVVSIAAAGLDLHDAQRYAGGATDTTPDPGSALASFYGFAFAVQLTTVIAFLRWLAPAYRALPSFGATPRFTPGWALGAWFVPILNLWRPKQIVNDVWRASDPEAAPPRAPADWPQRPVPALFAWWWAAWLVASLVAARAALFSTQSKSAPALERAASLMVASDVLDAVAAVLAILVVRRITARWLARAQAAAAVPPAAEPATPAAAPSSSGWLPPVPPSS